MLLLPLAYNGRTRIRALGVLAPMVPPYWLGAKPVSELELVSLRHIGPQLTGRGIPHFGQRADASRVQHGFVVYSGGRGTPPGERAS